MQTVTAAAIGAWCIEFGARTVTAWPFSVSKSRPPSWHSASYWWPCLRKTNP